MFIFVLYHGFIFFQSEIEVYGREEVNIQKIFSLSRSNAATKSSGNKACQRRCFHDNRCQLAKSCVSIEVVTFITYTSKFLLL